MFRSIEIQGYTCTACDLFFQILDVLHEWTYTAEFDVQVHSTLSTKARQETKGEQRYPWAPSTPAWEYREPVQKKLLLRVEVKDLSIHISTQSFLFFILVACWCWWSCQHLTSPLNSRIATLSFRTEECHDSVHFTMWPSFSTCIQTAINI